MFIKIAFMVLYILGLFIAAYNFKLTKKFKDHIKDYNKIGDISEEYFSDKYTSGTILLIIYAILFFIYIIVSIILKFTTGTVGFSFFKMILMAILANIVSKSLTTRYKAANKKCIQILEDQTDSQNVQFDFIKDYDEDNKYITYKIGEKIEYMQEA